MSMCIAGDTSSSSGYEEYEAIPTAQGLRFGDVPSPSGSEFNSPRASMMPDTRSASLSWLGQPESSRDAEAMSSFAAAGAPAGAVVAAGGMMPHQARMHGPQVSSSSASLLPPAF